MNEQQMKMFSIKIRFLEGKKHFLPRRKGFGCVLHVVVALSKLRSEWQRGEAFYSFNASSSLFCVCVSVLPLFQCVNSFRLEPKNTRHWNRAELVLMKYEHVVIKCRRSKKKSSRQRLLCYSMLAWAMFEHTVFTSTEYSLRFFEV